MKRIAAVVLASLIATPGVTLARSIDSLSPSRPQAAAQGTVAGWVAFGVTHVTQATVVISCQKGCNDAQTTVVAAASFDCAPYLALAGARGLTGDCFHFKGIPKGQSVTVHIGYDDGAQATLKGYFFAWQPFGWMGVATYPAHRNKLPAAPSNLKAIPAALNEVDLAAIHLSWKWKGDSHRLTGFRIFWCKTHIPCTPQHTMTVVAGKTM
jgi:hypothetical protein